MQQYSLLATKLFRPSLNPVLVSRSRLMQQLDANLGPGETFTRKLTLISAPAGFGKTTVFTEWLEYLAHAGTPLTTAWLSLDEGDSDPSRFLHYIIAALRQLEAFDDYVGEGIFSMLQAPERPSWETILTPLLNALATIDKRALLVLDDCHLIQGQAIQDILTFLIDYLPVQVHIALITREDPPLALSRLRVRRQLTELRAVDLRFTRDEINSFIENITGRHLPEGDLAALEQRTEGWVAGLQLATLSMKGQQDISAFVRSFTGSHRYVLDYLIEEVLEQQSQDIQRFLVQTSILDRLCVDLCDTITGKTNALANLAYLEQANLFLIPLDNERHWYRYHHLFADLLRERYNRAVTEPVTALHLRASHWFEQRHLMDEAIDHALKAGDTQRALNLSDTIADVLWKNGQSEKIMQLLSRLPEQDIHRCPRLTIYSSWYDFINGRVVEAQKSIDAAEAIFRKMESEAGTDEFPIINNGTLTRANLQGRLAAVRTFMDSYTGDVTGMATHAQQALASLAETDTTWRGLTNLTLGDLYGFQGNMPASYRARSDALDTCKASGDVYFALLAAGKLVISLREQGDLLETIALCEQELAFADKVGLSQVPMKGLLQVLWGETLFETNQTESGETRVVAGLSLAEQGLSGLYAGWAYACLARIAFSKGEYSKISELDDKLQQLATGHNVPSWILGMMAIWQARVLLIEQDFDALQVWLDTRKLQAINLENVTWIPYFALYDYLILARFLLAQGKLQTSADLLDRLMRITEDGGRIASIIEILLLQVLVHQEAGDLGAASAALDKALALAEPRKFVRIFVDQGPKLAKLLYDALSRTNRPAYIQELLSAFRNTPEKAIPAQPKTNTASPLIEPLSDREMDVLALIAEGLTNPEIGRRLYVSLNTIKVHTRNIFGKLSVHNRTQAVTRAQELGILSID